MKQQLPGRLFAEVSLDNIKDVDELQYLNTQAN